MRPETEARIRSVQKFGRFARSFCAFVATLLAIFTLITWAVLLSGPQVASDFTIKLGAFNVTGEQLTTVPIRAWSFIVVTIVMSVLAGALFHLHRLFSHLAAGAIYTKQNVYHLRQVGLLAMAMAVVQLILPPISFVLAETGFIDRALVTMVGSEDNGKALVFGSSSFGGFITAALILLASWIMDVGREVSDDAEALRREADLVI
jgi:hypothetical protein